MLKWLKLKWCCHDCIAAMILTFWWSFTTWYFLVRRNTLKQGNSQVSWQSFFFVYSKRSILHRKTQGAMKEVDHLKCSLDNNILPSATPQPALCSAQPARERLPPGGRSSVRASSSCRLWGCGWCCTLTESAPSVGCGLWRTCNTKRENEIGSWMAWHDVTALLVFHCVWMDTFAFDLLPAVCCPWWHRAAWSTGRSAFSAAGTHKSENPWPDPWTPLLTATGDASSGPFHPPPLRRRTRRSCSWHPSHNLPITRTSII